MEIIFVVQFHITADCLVCRLRPYLLQASIYLKLQSNQMLWYHATRSKWRYQVILPPYCRHLQCIANQYDRSICVV